MEKDRDDLTHMDTTTPTIQPQTQEQLDEAAVRAYIRHRSYRKAAEAECLTRSALHRRVKRWLRRSEARQSGTPMGVSDFAQ